MAGIVGVAVRVLGVATCAIIDVVSVAGIGIGTGVVAWSKILVVQ